MALASRCKWRWLQPCTVLFGLLLWTIHGVSCQGPLFTADGGTKLIDYQTATKHNLPHPILFYGQKYSDIYVSPDGIIGFDSRVGFVHTEYFWETKYPIIAPFYYMSEKPESQRSQDTVIGTIWINQTTNASLLQELSSIVNSNALGVRHFAARFAVVVTWDHVTDFQSVAEAQCTPAQASLGHCHTNTFQAVIVANADTTAVIFNYAEINNDCPRCGAGVSGGQNRDHVLLLPCQTNDCFYTHSNDLPNIQGTDVKGRFLFLVSRTAPTRGGCVDIETRYEHQTYLDFYPKDVGMFGGEIIDFTPPCVSSVSPRQITCVFGNQISSTAFRSVQGRNINTKSTKMRCVMPRLTVRGELNWTVTAISQTFPTVQPLTVILPSRQASTLNPGSKGWNETNPHELRLTWHPQLLSQSPGTHVETYLVLYREDAATGKTIWKEIMLDGDTSNDHGSLLFNPQDKKCQGEDCELFEIGVGEVRLKSQYLDNAESHGVLTYGTIPLGWWMHEAMIAKHGEKWPARRCEIWHEQDRQDRKWEEELLHCPCNLLQAITDFGRWQTDMGCNMYTGSVCTYHRGAKHCVRSVQPSNPGGHGNQCCYQEDGALLYAADSYQGSTPDRGHDWGAAPYDKAGRVPSLSHWIHDVITFYYCCLWDEYKSCDKYMDLRGTRDCKGYQVPKSAVAYGDPHIMTFDGKTYTMGGKGDFWLLQITSGLMVQAKLAVWGYNSTSVGTGITKYNGTGMTAVAMQGGNSPNVVIQLEDPTKQDSGLDVVVGGQRRYFLREEDFWQDFQDVSVVNNVAVNAAIPHSNFTVIFSCGAGVMVAAVRGFLHVTVVVPPQAKSRTSGLLGSWDDNPENDFRSKNGLSISSSAEAMLKYKNFSLSWKVTKEESLFPGNSQTEVDMNFVPNFPENVKLVSEAFCQDSTPCNLDYAITRNRDFALTSKTAQERFNQIRSFQTQELNCGWLPVPRATKSSFSNKVGSTITITGCRNGNQVRGQTTYTCVRRGDSAAWDPEITAACTAAVDMSQSTGMIIGIVVGIVALVIIAAIVAVIFYRRYKSHSLAKGQDSEKGGSEKRFDSVRYEQAAKVEEEPQRSKSSL